MNCGLVIRSGDRSIRPQPPRRSPTYPVESHFASGCVGQRFKTAFSSSV